MTKTTSISIIVAVYNVEPYIRKCLESLKKQTFKDFEVLLINDGSTDGSGKICDEYAAKDKRFIVIHKKNGGVSSARNVGISMATGDYSIHVDPDDFVAPEMCERMHNYANKHKLDLVWCDYFKVTSSQTKYMSQKIKEIDNESYIKSLLTGSMHGCMWNKLIKTNLYQRYSVNFSDDLRVCEDVYINIKFAMRNINIGYLNESFYHYVDNPNSLTTSKSKSTYEFRDKYLSKLINEPEIKNKFLHEIHLSILLLKIDMIFSRLYDSVEILRYYSDINWKIFYFEMPLKLKLYYYICLKLGKALK